MPEFSQHRQMLREEQLRRLDAAARQSGRWADWIYFHAAQGSVAPLEALRQEATLSQDDALLLNLLLGGQKTALSECLQQASDPWVFYTAVKTFLRNAEVDAALQIVEWSLAAGSVAAINLLIQFLSQQRNDSLARELAKISLQVAPRQQDLQRSLDTGGRVPGRWPLYLEPLPMPMPCAFYLPAYNMSAYLARAIDGALGQCAPLDAFLVVDDGSSDDTAAIASGFPVQLVRHEANRGLSAARNTAFQLVDSAWVASVDADAFPAATFLKYAFMELENAPTAVAGAGGQLLEFHTDAPADLWRSLHLSQNPGSRRIQPPDFLFGSNTVYSREAILAVGGFDERFRTNAEDGYIAEQLRAAGRSFTYTPHASAHHLRRDTPLSVVRMFWGWAADTLEKKGEFSSAQRILDGISHRVREMVTLVNDDIAAGHPSAAYISVLYFFGTAGLALRAGVARGHFTAALAQNLEAALLDALSLLGTRFGHRLETRLRGDLSGLDTWPPGPATCEPAALPEALGSALAEVFAAIGPEVYEILAGAS